MNIILNGEPKQLEAGTTVSKLLEHLNMQPRYVAVERNRDLLPRAEHADCVLDEGDCLEVVTLVGGG